MRFPGESEYYRFLCDKEPVSTPGSGKYILLNKFNQPAPQLYKIVEACSQPLPSLLIEEECYPELTVTDTAYLIKLENLITELKSNNSKVVISREIATNAKGNISEIFCNLCALNPSALVFSFEHEGEWWLGATPEVLLKSDGKQLSTMALAGTRIAGTLEPWDKKNIEEQRYVTDFILDSLRAAGLTPEAEKSVTLRAANVEHICTRITAALPADFDLLSLIGTLSPTPAVAGFPRDYALKKIAEIEASERGFYAGTIGIVENKQAALYVILRVMHIDTAGQTKIRVGGGITHQSIPADELAETQNKAKLLFTALSPKILTNKNFIIK